MTARTRIVVMAKAPVAGYAKTRLIPALGADGAAALAERLLAQAIDHALAAGLGRAAGVVELCAAPDLDHPAIARWAAHPVVTLTAQGGGDLGARMARAFERGLPTHDHVLMTGTDAPALDAAVLRQAAAALADHDAVFVPAHDGGYALIGLRQPVPELFDDMPWSTPAVMAITRERLRRLGLRHAELAPLHDIDEPADLVHLPPGWLPRGAFAADA
ncbi:MAG: TIGR04282 family arsenosugar biosynthesis glycosyltransferase [Leptothrix sp. (in: b-proteobacteria)]